MRVSRLTLVGAAATVLAGTVLIGPAPAGAVSAPPPKAAVFVNGTYVDTGAGDEVENVVTTLTEGGVQVTTFEGITAADFTAALAGQDLFVLPELESAEPGALATDMGPDSRAVVKDWVDAGGRLVVFGSDTPWVDVDAIFGTDYDGERYNEICFEEAGAEPGAVANGDGPPADVQAVGSCTKTAAAADTEFADGPDTLDYNDDTSSTPVNLPADAHTVYEWIDGSAAVTSIPQGLGAIVFLAWDWFGAYDDGGDGAQLSATPAPGVDTGWFDVLLAATDATVAVSDATAVEATPVTFTVSLPGGPVSQDVVVDYATADGTAVAGTDYTTTAGSVVIPTGSTSVTVSVPTLARAGTQGPRTFDLDIGAPFFAQVADGTGVGTITDAPDATTTTTSTTTVPTTAAKAVVVTPTFAG